ncbi:hypothetical protein [Vibrio mexicanus]|uniref:hypothetical protein n=1 Tax=Vibrio mexicanus TaxID=1004326 RepID=UPI00063CF015|nr:hypothetical protein [Vibrio mexicanus]
MKFNKSYLAVAVVSGIMLSGCGSDSNSSGSQGGDDTAKEKQITVIDGYVGGAEVCADTNNDRSCGV